MQEEVKEANGEGTAKIKEAGRHREEDRRGRERVQRRLKRHRKGTEKQIVNLFLSDSLSELARNLGPNLCICNNMVKIRLRLGSP